MTPTWIIVALALITVIALLVNWRVSILRDEYEQREKSLNRELEDMRGYAHNIWLQHQELLMFLNIQHYDDSGYRKKEGSE